MAAYFLGADLGASRTRVIIADSNGNPVGFGETGPGNHESVGYDGMQEAIHGAVNQALQSADLSIQQIAGAGFGVAGYDWPSQWEPNMAVLKTLGILGPIEMVNDTIIGLVAGADEGWGIGLVSGTGCNCWGWDQTHQKIAHVTGGGSWMGEAAGAGELVRRAVQCVAQEWTGRGPATRMTQMFISHCGVKNLEELLESIMDLRCEINAAQAPMVFQAARDGDAVAIRLLEWAGNELAELAKAVVRQIGIQHMAFDVVLIGGLFSGGPLLIEPLKQALQEYSPHARLVRLNAPPVIGGVLLGMQKNGINPTADIRQNLQRFDGFR
jgi:N-acetylglucosamine kinase-like BadF-type ATPase